MGYREAYILSAWKWLGLVSAIWVQAIAGNDYTFSNYSNAIKTLMNLTQHQLNNLSVAKDVGKAFGVVSGLATDRIPTPVIILIGAIEGLFGYGVPWLVVSKRIQPLSYWQMCIFLCMAGNSTTWMNTAVLVTCMRNFRRNRGPVSGILKGYIGLSTALLTDLSGALFSDDPAKFLIMLTVVPFVVCLIAIFFLREIPESESASVATEKEESRYFTIFNVIAVVIASYLLTYDLIGSTNQVFSLVFAIVLLILLASSLVVPAYCFLKSWCLVGSEPDMEQHEPLLKPEGNSTTAQNEGPPVMADDEVVAVVEKIGPVLGEDHTIFEMMQTWEFWLVFVSFLCGTGSGLAVMNNMSQMGLALGHTDVSIFVSLTSIWGFFGRIISGSVSEYFLKKSGTPRPVWNAASQILMVVGFLIMAVAMPGCLYIGSIIVGICYGVRLTITVPVASELFGLKYYGLLYNILILNFSIGSFLFSGLLAGYLYDTQATPSPEGGNTCVGSHCYRLVFIIMAIASVIGFGLDVLLTMRTKNIYTKIFTSSKSSTMISNGQQ